MSNHPRACPHCGTPMDGTIEDYPYQFPGLEKVVLSGIKIDRCQSDGEEIVGLPAVEKLHRLLAAMAASNGNTAQRIAYRHGEWRSELA